jgi:hypothetical protein
VDQAVTKPYSAVIADTALLNGKYQIAIDAKTYERDTKRVLADIREISDKIKKENSKAIIETVIIGKTSAEWPYRALTDLSGLDPNASRAFISDENGQEAGEGILTLQVVKQAKTLRGVVWAALALSVKPDAKLAGVEKRGNVFIIQPLGARLAELLERAELTAVSAGTSA